ncbi:MAG: type II toxin-antitoxin system VapC family toxin [bacterium]
MTEERDGQELAAALESAPTPVTSPIAVWEAAASISRKTNQSAAKEFAIVLEFPDLAEIQIEPIDMAVTEAAIAAFDRYGRRSGHPADLNMGDCFAYAFARVRKLSLLFKGKDFLLTNVQTYAEGQSDHCDE